MTTPERPPAPPPLEEGPLPQEPLLAMGVRGSLVAAVLALLVAFGFHLTAGQQAAILGVAAAVGPFLAAWAARGQVYSPESVRRLLHWAKTDTTPEADK